MGLQRVIHDWATELNWTECLLPVPIAHCQFLLPNVSIFWENVLFSFHQEYFKVIYFLNCVSENIFLLALYLNNILDSYIVLGLFFFPPLEVYKHWCICYLLVLLPGKSHGWRSLVGCSPWGHEESDTTEWLHFHISLFTFMHWRRKCNPLLCSCLENPRDGKAWWAAV